MPISRIFAFIGLCMFALGDPALANEQRDLQRAQKLLAKGEFAQAYEKFAEIDHPLAYFSRGMMHEVGMGRAAARSEACRWYAKSAEGKIPTGMVKHAECLVDGVLGQADPAAAAPWFERAAEQGYHLASCELGRLYMQGKGVPQDKPKALQLCGQAAKAGSPQAMLQLAHWYHSDDQDLHDANKAINWYYSAAEHQHPQAQYEFGMLVLGGAVNEIEPPRSLKWLEGAASQGKVEAYLPVAAQYWTRRSEQYPDNPSPHDLAKAYVWAKAAKKVGDRRLHKEATRLLAEINALMPPSWQPDLDAKVAAHLQQHHTEGD